MKVLKIIVIVFLGWLIIFFGGVIGGVFGDFMSIVGGVGVVFGVIDVLKRKRSANPRLNS